MFPSFKATRTDCRIRPGALTPIDAMSEFMLVVVIVIHSPFLSVLHQILCSSQHLSSPPMTYVADTITPPFRGYAQNRCNLLLASRRHKGFHKSSRSGRRNSLRQVPPSAAKLLSYSQYDLSDLLV